MAGGCLRPPPSKPQTYFVKGRVVDAATGQGLPYARVLLRAAIPTDRGPQILSSYSFTGAQGAYEAELSEGFDVVRAATHIRVDAARDGYSPGGVDLPAPTQKESVYMAPDIVLAPRGDAALPPAATPQVPGVPTFPQGPARPNPLPWKQGDSE